MVDDSFVCSLCCGRSRKPDKCTGCSYYKDVSHNRNYRKVPFYGTQQMSDSMKLQNISDVVESILCGFDFEAEDDDEFTDKAALQLLELVFDKYHFKDSELSFNNSTVEIQFERMSQAIEQDLSDISKEQQIKVMASKNHSFSSCTK